MASFQQLIPVLDSETRSVTFEHEFEHVVSLKYQVWFELPHWLGEVNI